MSSRSKSRSKGQLKLLEAMIASLLLFATVSFMLGFSVKPPEAQSLDIKNQIYNSLNALNQRNELRELAYANNTTGIKKKISPYLPLTFDYKVLICKDSCKYTREEERVYSVSYLLGTDRKLFENREVLVYAWK